MSSLYLQLCCWVAKCQNRKKGCIQILHGTKYGDVIRWLAGVATRRKNLQATCMGSQCTCTSGSSDSPGQQLGQHQGGNTGSKVSNNSRASEEENPIHEILEGFPKVLAAGPWAPYEQIVLSRPIRIGDSQMLPLGPCATWRNMLLCSISWDRNSSNPLSKCS